MNETSPLPKLTLGYGVLLILLGIGGYVASGTSSVTAFIPAFFGIPLALLGWVAGKEKWRKHAMHGAVLLGVLGLLGTFRGLFQLPAFFDGTAARPLAVVSQSIMAVLSLAFVIICVKSFMDARRAKG